MQAFERRLGWIIVCAVVLCIAWLRWPSIVGTPGWLGQAEFLCWLKKLSPLDQWVTAVGTVLAVIYAIFHEMFLMWLRRPKLKVLFEKKEPYVISIPIRRPSPEGDLQPSYQVRMLISNEGTNRAESVGVYAKRLYRRDETDRELLPWFLPMDLTWAEDGRVTTAISAGVERTCNLVEIAKPRQSAKPYPEPPQAPRDFDYAQDCFARIQTAADPTSRSSFVYPANYRLELVLSAANAKSQSLNFDFKFDGRWFDNLPEMMPAAASFELELSPHS